MSDPNENVDGEDPNANGEGSDPNAGGDSGRGQEYPNANTDANAVREEGGEGADGDKARDATNGEVGEISAEEGGGGSKRPKMRIGNYKLGKKQFLPTPYIFIPGNVLTSSRFNFHKVFEAFGLQTPSLMFRLSQALQPATWNVKLPKSRYEDLTKAYNSLPSTLKKKRSIKFTSSKSHKNLFPIKAKETVKGQSDDYNPNARGKLDHYAAVLEENSRRLMRNINSACNQAQTMFRVHEIWSDQFHEDVVARWVQESNPKGSPPNIIGIADMRDFHDEIWGCLEAGCFEKTNEAWLDGNVPETVILDPKPFYKMEEGYKVEYDEITGEPKKSIPHPAITHLIISENRMLLEQKLGEIVPWGCMVINGAVRATELCVQALQLGLPVISFKFTGGAADMMVEMYEKVDAWVAAKRGAQLNSLSKLPPIPFEEWVYEGYQQAEWLMPFDATHVKCCRMFNMLVENWPDRHNKESVFIIDMFSTSEDDVQDKLTLTLSAVDGGDYELGGVLSEQRRISYAWRCRHKFIYNASIYKFVSDILTAIITLLTMLSTFASCFYTFYSADPTSATAITAIPLLLMLNLVLPLGASVVKGIFASISPYLKYVALKNAGVRVESEIYAFRAKVCQYSSRKQPDEEEEEEEDDDAESKEKIQGGGGDPNAPNPRKSFFQAIDKVFLELSSSDVQNGALRMPTFPSQALDDVNARIRSNRKEQNTYLIPMKRKISDDHAAALPPQPQKIIDLPGEAFDVHVQAADPHAHAHAHPPAAGGDASATAAPPKPALKTPKIYIGGMDDIELDDGISPISADDYVVLRVIPMVAHLSKQAPALVFRKNLSQALGVIFSVMASAFTGFDLVAFIPAVLAVAGGVTAVTNYLQIELRLLQVNSARAQLHQLLVWWDALTLIEKRVPANKDQLVKKTEATIQAQATIFQGGGGGGDEEEEEDQGGKK